MKEAERAGARQRGQGRGIEGRCEAQAEATKAGIQGLIEGEKLRNRERWADKTKN